MSERECRMRWIAVCRLDSKINVTKHTRISSIHFEEVLGPTKLNTVPSIFIFPQHLRRKPPKSRADPEERCRKQWKETPQTSRSKKVFTPRKKKQDVNRLERRIVCFWKSQYSLLSACTRPVPVYVDAEVQTDLTASEIEVSSRASS